MLDSGEFIEIKGDLAQLVERRVMRQVPLSEVFKGLNTESEFTMPLIARSQVFSHVAITPEGKRLMAMTEIPPGIKVITKDQHYGTRRYRLAMPWTYLWLSMVSTDNDRTWSFVNEGYRIFHARRRFSSIDDEMIIARLPNVYNGSGNICWGNTGADANQSLADRLDQLTNEWYVSRFNSDLDSQIPLPYGEPNYARWVRESREDPNCWQRWPEWNTEEKFTVRKLLEGEGFVPRTERIELPGSIPEVPRRLTFGRVEQWLNEELTPEQRTQFFVGLRNIGVTDDNLPPVGEPQAVTNNNIEDDGGEPV